jgi:hypothetical protein
MNDKREYCMTGAIKKQSKEKIKREKVTRV